MDTIIEKYCVNKKRPSLQCNGKCYLSKQLHRNTSSTSDTPTTTPIVEAFIPLFFETYSIAIETPMYFSEMQTQFWGYITQNPSSYKGTIDHPPEFHMS